MAFLIKVKKVIIVASVPGFVSCASMKMKVEVPSRFAAQATAMHIRNLRGLKTPRQLAFGSYFISDLKRGWISRNEINNTPGSFLGRQQLLQLFNTSEYDILVREKNKYHYQVNDEKFSAKIFCEERFRQERHQLKGHYTGSYSKAGVTIYNLTGIILAYTSTDTSLWNLHLSKGNDITELTHDLFNFHYMDETGYITDGKDTITIRPVRIYKAESDKNKIIDLPLKLQGGYEFRINDRVIGITDMLNDNIWLYNDMSNETKLIIVSAASALLLRRQNH